MTATEPRLVVDLLDPELYRRNPHDVWTWMRANEPVYRDERNGLWGVSRHADLLDVERRSAVFVSGLGYRAHWSPDEQNMIAQDDPRHRQQRLLVQPRFTRGAVVNHAEEYRTLINELIDAFVGAGELEVVDEFAGQLPARFTARLLGFPEDRWRDIKTWAEKLMRTDERDRSGKVFFEFLEANMEYVAAVQEMAPAKIAGEGDDLISFWLKATLDGEPLPLPAVIHEIGLFIAGGAETTRTALAHGLRTFADHPEQWEALAADPSLAPAAADEVIRWVTPLNNMFRRAIQDDHVGGVPIGRGDRLILLYPSANRDESVFEEPFTFDIRRNPNPHVAFGHGTHMCLGLNFAKQTIATALAELSARITNLTPITEPDIEPNIFARSVRSFRLGFTAR